MIWISIISFITMLCIMVYAAEKGKLDWVGIGIVVGLLILILSISLAFVLFPQKMTPSPIDVYRNRTTLEITYKDGVPIDTIVVYKDDYLKTLGL